MNASAVRKDSVVEWCRRAAVALVFVVAALNWFGWAADLPTITRLRPEWPAMTPWTALWLAMLSAAVLLQSGTSTRRRRVAVGLTALVALPAIAILIEYRTGARFGIDQLWFADGVRNMRSPWPGRPSPQTVWSVLALTFAITVARVDTRWARLAWPGLLLGAAIIPVVSTAAYLFDAMALVTVAPSTGQAVHTALSLLLLIFAISAVRPDRPPLAWLLGRPDRVALLRLIGALGGLPVVVALSQFAFQRFGFRDQAAWALSVAVGTVVVGAVTVYLTQREQRVLIERDLASSARVDAEQRYRILADNAVDIVVHLRGDDVAWVSPSVGAALGGTPGDWVGAGFRNRVHRRDLDVLADALRRIAGGDSVLQRFRVRAVDGGWHWVDGHAKPYVDAGGETDGLIASLRIVDAQVEAEQRLERLARFDTLTGLANRAEAIARLEVELVHTPTPGTHLGILFCDVDHFKEINDTWGHAMGDTVLATLAARIVECVRAEDTVGRTGGDEILVLLPGIQSIEDAETMAEKIRCHAATPIVAFGTSVHPTVSIGATIATSGESVVAVTARADAAMYEAKMRAKGEITRIAAAE